MNIEVKQKCYVCMSNLSNLSISDKEKHINICLDEQENRLCPSCRCSLHHLVIQDRIIHVNHCLDSNHLTKKNKKVEFGDMIQKVSLKNIPMIKSIRDKRMDIFKKTKNEFIEAKESKNEKRKRPRCPSFKMVEGLDNLPFIVDGFSYASKELSSIYFLTHFHSDHYWGLTNKFYYGKIYCTEATAKLVISQLRIQKEYICPVPYNETFSIHNVKVTFMDANHCPGAAIILFCFPNGKNYLHTGDFRFNEKMMRYPHLIKFLQGNNKIRLDAVYLDTTYCNPKYTFPPQHIVIQQVINVIQKHLDEDIKTLYLFGTYSIGKERLFLEVADKLKCKIYIDKIKAKMIRCFEWPKETMSMLTEEDSVTNFRAVQMHCTRFDHMELLQKQHRLRYKRFISFQPTGWKFPKSSKQSSLLTKVKKNNENASFICYGVPYSEHSSFSELCDFIMAFNPETVIPTVDCNTIEKVRKQKDLLRQACFSKITNHFKQKNLTDI